MNHKFTNQTEFTFYGDGEQTRDFVYINDLIDAMWLVLNTPTTSGSIFNIGTGIQTNLKAVLKRLRRASSTVSHAILKHQDLEILSILVLTLHHLNHWVIILNMI